MLTFCSCNIRLLSVTLLYSSSMFLLLPECNFTFSTKTTSQPHCRQRGLQKVLKISDEYRLTTPASDRLIRHRFGTEFFCTLSQLTCKSGVKKGVVCIEFAREKRKKRSTLTTPRDLFVCLLLPGTCRKL